MIRAAQLLVAAGVAAAASGACRRAADASATSDRSYGGDVWGADYFPNVPLVTHRGDHVRFFELIRDKVVAINFMYTRCGDSCPLETARMVEVQKLLRDRLGRDVFFLSISIDPAHDTPEVLRAYATAWNVADGWTFLTGAEADIVALRKKLGVYEPDAAKRDHNLSLIIGNQKTGRWMRRSPGENPYVLANELGSWLHNWSRVGPSDRDFARAPEVRNLSAGEELFRARCATCHTVGQGDRGELADRRVGPDLIDVHRRRDRGWLVQWIVAPDLMLASNDPVAGELFERYGRIPMPNLRLTPADADELLRFLEDESAGVRRRSSAAEAARTPLAAAELADARARFDDYGCVQEALAADRLDHARRCGGAATGRPASRSPRLAAIDDEAARVREATTIEQARAAFAELSRQVVAVAVGTPALREGRQLVACRMAPGYRKWLQTTAEIRNPLWGSRMPRCGAVESRWEI